MAKYSRPGILVIISEEGISSKFCGTCLSTKVGGSGIVVELSKLEIARPDTLAHCRTFSPCIVFSLFLTWVVCVSSVFSFKAASWVIYVTFDWSSRMASPSIFKLLMVFWMITGHVLL